MTNLLWIKIGRKSEFFSPILIRIFGHRLPCRQNNLKTFFTTKILTNKNLSLTQNINLNYLQFNVTKRTGLICNIIKLEYFRGDLRLFLKHHLVAIKSIVSTNTRGSLSLLQWQLCDHTNFMSCFQFIIERRFWTFIV